MLRSLLGGMFTKVAVAALNFAILLVSSRYLGPASRGEIGLYLLNVALVQLCNEVYTGYGLVRLVPEMDSARLKRTGIVFSLVVTPSFYLILVLFGVQVPGYEWLGLSTCILVVLHTFFCVLLLAKGAFRLYNLLCMLQPALLFLLMCTVIFGSRQYTFASYSWPLFWSFFLACIVSAAVLSKFSSRPGTFSLRRILKDGFVYQASIIMLMLVNRLSFYLLDDKVELGIYAVATSLMDASLVFTAGIVPPLLFRVSASPAETGNVHLASTLSKLSVLFSLLLIGVLLLLPDSFFTAVLGNGFAPLRKIMLLYAPGALLLGYSTTLAAYLNGAGFQRLVGLAYGGGLLSTVILAPWLVKTHHMAGAAAVACISYTVIAVLVSVFCSRKGHMSFRSFLSAKPDLGPIKRAN